MKNKIFGTMAIIALLTVACNDNTDNLDPKPEEKPKEEINAPILESHIEDEIAVFEEVEFGTGYYYFDAELVDANLTGSLEIRLDSDSGQLVGTCVVSPERLAANDMRTVTAIRGAKGTHDVHLVWKGTEGTITKIKQPRFFAGKPRSL